MFDLIALIRSSHWSATEVRAPHTRCMNRAAQHHAHADRSDAIVILATVRRPPVYILRVLERMHHHERHAIAQRVLRYRPPFMCSSSSHAQHVQQKLLLETSEQRVAGSVVTKDAPACLGEPSASRLSGLRLSSPASRERLRVVSNAGAAWLWQPERRTRYPRS